MSDDRSLAGTRLGRLALPPALAEALVRSVGDGLYVVDRAGRLVMLNPAAERLLGYAEDELRGREVHDVTHAHVPRAACRLLGVLETAAPVHAELDTLRRRDGRLIEVTYTSSPIVQDGAVAGAVVVFRDVTAEREAARRAERLAAERRAIGDELQLGLLPAGLVDVPGAEHAAGFRPVGSGVLIGGDFYDVFATARGHVVVLGDVQGKGPQAAAVATMVRFLLRGCCAGQDPDLPRALALVNEQLKDHPSERYCTLALAHAVRGDAGSLRVEIACAGHPQPVRLTADGAAEHVGARAAVVGLWDAYRADAEEVVLAPGDSLVLYSDGLNDVGRLAGRGSFDVRAALEGEAGRSAAHLVSLLERRAGVPETEDPPDDIAVLVLRALPQAAAAGVSGAPRDDVPEDLAEVGQVESRFRDLNEHLAEGRPVRERAIAIVCECGHPTCEELVEVPRDAYDAVRAHGRRFFVLPGHDLPQAERVVAQGPGFAVVEKVGEAGLSAEQAAE